MGGESGELRIGTRGSRLALWQAKHVASRVEALPGAPSVRIVTVETSGDRIRDVPLSSVAGRGFFTKEIEAALLEDRIDVAVHSLKDLETEMPAGLALGAVLEREDPRDVWIGRAGASGELPRGARVGTSSLRRRAFLARWRGDLELAELRGNVPTRVRKLDDGDYDAIVLAAAGVKRLGFEERIAAYLPVEHVLPAVGQGAIGVQLRESDDGNRRWVASLDHADTRAATAAERAMLRVLEGGCQVPVGALGTVEGGVVRLRGAVCRPDGAESVEASGDGPVGEAERIGREVAEELLADGADAILAGIRNA